ncbi:MAG: putative response regulator [Ramlibacter sp.]|jgi:TolB-like protein/DNA-binding winged helix-turn-helix (wHTH) protein|nr:putative response regulator [Ramlibacter sp.]
MATNRLTLGEFVLDLEAGELFAAGGQLAGLRKQALDVLLALGRRPGQVVSKDELIQLVWPNVVVSEGSLTQAIADIRRVLGDSEHLVVRNVARRGYMLVPDELPPAAGDEAPSPARDSPQAPAPAVAVAMLRPRWRNAALLGGLLLAVLLAGGGWLASRITRDAWQSPADLARAPLPREVPPLSIIVLPLTLEGEASEAEWLADALHGDLVLAVAQLQNSLVIARDTASTYKGKAADPRQVAREMGVRHVVQGSLRREGERVRINLALIDGESGVQRWAETFGVERAELAQAVGDFAVAMERTLVAELYRSTARRSVTLSPAEVTADDLAMQGYALWYRGVTRENVLAARALFDRAVAMNPDSARAWGGVHFTTANMVFNGWTDDRAAALRRAEEATANLERLDRDGNYTYSSRVFLLVQKYRDYPAMLRQTTEWSERYRLPLAFGAHGMALVLNGRFDDAVPALERALRLGPRDPYRAEWQYRLALAHFGAGRYELARDWSQTAANTTPTLRWPPIHAAALLRLGRRDAAQQAFDEHMRRHPGFAAGQVTARFPSEEAAHSELRSRLIESLRELGMRE